MKYYILIVFLAVTQFLFAQEFNQAKLDEYFSLLTRHNRFMGSVALSKEGKIIYQKAIGFSDVENNRKATSASRYRIASISKTFTAVLVMKAVEEEKLQPGQTIGRFFPSVKNSDRITIQHLLNHRSGIWDFTSDKDYLNWNSRPRSRAEMVRLIAEGGSTFDSGEKSRYSNSNYVLLTYILEDVFEKTYAGLLSEYITQPLGLTNTYVGGEIDPTDRESHSYSYLISWQKATETDPSVTVGAGAIVSTPADLTAFSDALFGGKLLTEASVEKMKTMNGQFGLGLAEFSFHDKTGYGHTGRIDEFTTIFIHFPEEKVSYALTSNGTIINKNDITSTVLSAAFNQPFELPEYKTYNVTEGELEQYPGTYTSKQIPLKVMVSKNENALSAQATGQPAFPLEAIDKHTFRYERAGIVMEFNPEEKTMILKQGGGEFLYKME
ncbi:MAG: serine hydrolase domain-containing protein [Mariniphaga sp.]